MGFRMQDKTESTPLSLREFAKLVGVSRTTVSRAFSENGHIAETTRQRILDLAEKHDFRPSPVMQPATRAGATRSIGVLYPGFSISYYQDMQFGLQERLLEAGYLPIMLAVRAHSLKACLQRLVDHRIEALILTAWEEAFFPEDRAYLDRLGMAIVCLGQRAHRLFPDSDLVDTDDQLGGSLAARHLLELGHHRIATIENRGGICDRMQSFLRTCQSKGTPVSDHLRLQWDATAATRSAAKLAETLAQRDRPTAIFTANDLVASRVYEVADSLGLAIPEDLSVVGYADLDFARRLRPPLTTIRTDGAKLGRIAADFAIQRVREPESELRQCLMPVELVRRQSTAAVVDGPSHANA